MTIFNVEISHGCELLCARGVQYFQDARRAVHLQERVNCISKLSWGVEPAEAGPIYVRGQTYVLRRSLGSVGIN